MNGNNLYLSDMNYQVIDYSRSSQSDADTSKSTDSIKSYDWFNYMNYLSGYDKVINYSWKNSGISKREKKEIRKIFREIDEVTGITFQKTKKKNDDLRFFSVKEIDDTTRLEINEQTNPFPVEDVIVGRASASNNRIKIFWRDEDKKVSYIEKYVLRHEIGHALGLSHPDGDGSNPDWDVSDTIMSYNVWSSPGLFTYYGYTNLDKQALEELWDPQPTDSFLPPKDIVENITIPV